MAAARLKEADATAQPAAPEHRPLWTIQEERSGARFARRFGRGLLWALVAILALTGLRALVYPNNKPPPAQKSAADEEPDFPVEDAQATASRYARAYLTWDEENPELRASLLAPDLPKGADSAAGWNGKGQQDVIVVQAGEVTTTGETTARVRITALVKSGADKDKDKKQDAASDVPRWTALDVPVATVQDRVVVSDTPALVGVPKTGPRLPAPKTSETDRELSVSTKPVIDRFFAEYAAGDITSELAPGSDLPALPAGTVFETATSWSVHQGKGERRTGTAVVVWRIAGAELSQTYSVEMTRVSASSGQRWQVATVHGGSRR